MKKMNVAVLLFDNFETLDVYGPVEVFGRLSDLYNIKFYSLNGGLIKNNHGVITLTETLESISDETEVFLIPGGYGTRREIDNIALIEKIKQIAASSKYVLTVCTGSSLLARTGLLDHKEATSNKIAFQWVVGNGMLVKWNKKARWTKDENIYTSSGVTAGIDMVLGFISDRHGIETAYKVVNEIEYIWNEDKDSDIFTVD